MMPQCVGGSVFDVCHCVIVTFFARFLLLILKALVRFAQIECDQSKMNENQLGRMRCRSGRVTEEEQVVKFGRELTGEEKERKRCKKRKGANMSLNIEKKRAGLMVCICWELCARLPCYSWQHPTMPACYHNEAINVKQLPHKLSGSTQLSEAHTNNSVFIMKK